MVSILAYMQKNRISHQKITLRNIYLFADGVYKLSDFENARYAKQRAFPYTKATELAGSRDRRYLAPELKNAAFSP